jgi:proteasome activator subunit 4
MLSAPASFSLLSFAPAQRVGAEERGDARAGAWGGALGAPARAAFSSGVLRLARRAQFAKSHDLAKAAASALAGLAYACPGDALPLVVRRFESALTSITATHQLVTSMDTLTLCIRPLLAAPPSALMAAAPEEGASGNAAAGGGGLAPPLELVAAALRASLPGLDANDPPKTLATLRLFAVTLSSLPGMLGGEGDDADVAAMDTSMGTNGASSASSAFCALPMDWGEWSDEALSRIFALLANLEPGGGATGGGAGDAPSGGDAGTADASSFLLYGSSMYRPFCELLFARLSPRLRAAAMRRLGRFAAGASTPGCASELGVLLNAAAWADPVGAAETLVRPAAAALTEELSHVRAGAPLTRAAETLLRARAGALASCLHCAGGAAAACRTDIEPALASLWAAATSAASQPLWDAASGLLIALLGALTVYYPLDQYAPEAAAAAAAGADADNADAWQPACVAAWLPAAPVGPVGPTGGGALPPGAALTWHEPSDAERAFADALLQTYAEAPAAAISAAASGASAPPGRDALRAALLQMEACLSGVRCGLPDFSDDDSAATASAVASSAASPADADAALSAYFARRGAPYGLVGALAPPGVGAPGCRARLAAALAAAPSIARGDDTEALLALLRGADDVLNPGHSEFEDYASSAAAWRADAGALTQPRAAPASLCGDASGGDDASSAHEASKRRRRRPRWLAAEGAYLSVCWRASQGGYFWAGVPPADASAPPAGSPAAALLAAVAALASHRYKGVRDAAAPVLEAALKRYPCAAPSLLAPFAAALAGGASDAAGSGEEAALGAAAALSCRTCSRAAAGDAGWQASLLRALLGSARHEGTRAQAAIQDLFLLLSFRFSRAALRAAPDEPGSGALGGPLGALRNELLTAGSQALRAASSSASSGDDAAKAASAVPTHWRYVLMAHALVAFLLRPGHEGAAAGPLAVHFAAALVSDVAPLRPLAAAALLPLLRAEGDASGADAHTPASGAASSALGASLREPAFVPRLCAQLALSHVIAGEGASGGSGGGGGMRAMMEALMGGGEALWRSLAAASSPREWPANKYAAACAGGGVFTLLHARLFDALARIDAAALLPALREPLSAAVATGDRGARALAAEALAGVLRAGAAATPAWEEWMRPLLLRGALEAPAEARGEWSSAVMFACSGPGAAGASGRAAVLAALAAPPQPGAASGTQARRLLLLRAALAEATQHCDATSAACPEAAAAVALLAEASALRAHPMRAVREEAAAAAAMLVALAAPLNDADGDASVAPPAPYTAAGAALALPALPPAEELGLFVGAGASGARGALASALRDEASRFCARLGPAADAAADAVLAAAPPSLAGSNGNSSSSSMMEVDTPSAFASAATSAGTSATDAAAAAASEAAVTWLESSLLWASCVAHHGDAAALRRPLLALLPAALRVTETADPDFDFVAKRALAYLKYVSFPPDALPLATATIVASSHAPAWHARGAALSLLAPFALRHAFALRADDGDALRGAVVARLGDTRHEVRQLAAATLAGLLQGPGAGAAPSLRARFAADAAAAATIAAAARAAARRAKASGVDAAASSAAAPALSGEELCAAHARVLGLSACILACPYDCPPWLPPLVAALAGAARAPAPAAVRATVTATFAEFKRTHADTWAATRAAFGEEAWAAAADGLSLSPSYFC